MLVCFNLLQKYKEKSNCSKKKLDISSLYLLCTFSVDGLYPIQRKYREGTSEIGGGADVVSGLCRNKVPVDGG